MVQIESMTDYQESSAVLSEGITSKDVSSLSVDEAEKEYKRVTSRLTKLFNKFVDINAKFNQLKKQEKGVFVSKQDSIAQKLEPSDVFILKVERLKDQWVDNRHSVDAAFADLENLTTRVQKSVSSSPVAEQKRFQTILFKVEQFYKDLGRKLTIISKLK